MSGELEFTTTKDSFIQVTRSILPVDGCFLEALGITKIEYTERGGVAVHLKPWGYLRSVRFVDGDVLTSVHLKKPKEPSLWERFLKCVRTTLTVREKDDG